MWVGFKTSDIQAYYSQHKMETRRRRTGSKTGASVSKPATIITKVVHYWTWTKHSSFKHTDVHVGFKTSDRHSSV